MSKTSEIKYIIKITTDRTICYLEDEVCVELENKDYKLSKIVPVEKRYTTTQMSITGSININIAFCFDQTLIKKIFTAYTADLEIPLKKQSQYLDETAGDMINIILGNATADLANPGSALEISTPLVIKDIESIIQDKDTNINVSNLHTDHGNMSILFFL